MSRGNRPIDRVAPEGFLDAYDADTIEDALRVAERAPTTSDPATFDRCPGEKENGDACLSTRLSPKPGSIPMTHKRGGTHKCPNGHHVSRFVAPRAAFDAADPVCPSCGSRRLVDADRVANGWECLDCGEGFDEATEAPDEDVPHARGDEATASIMPRDLKTETETYRIPTGDDLRQLRKALGLSLQEVPVAAGTTLGRWEREETAPRLDRLEELVEYYRTVDAVRRAARLDAALGELGVDPEPEEEAVEDAAPASPEADPFDWVEEADLRAATDGGEPEVEADTSRC